MHSSSIPNHDGSVDSFVFSHSNGVNDRTEVDESNDYNENFDRAIIPASLELAEHEDTAPLPLTSTCLSVTSGDHHDGSVTANKDALCSQNFSGAASKSGVGAMTPGNRPEYLASEGPPLPQPGIHYECAGNIKAFIAKTNTSSGVSRITTLGALDNESVSYHESVQESSSQVERDVEGQTTSSPGIVQAPGSNDVARRKVLYDHPPLASDVMHLSNDQDRRQTQRRLSFFRSFTIIPRRRVHQSVEMGEIPIPSTRGQKVRNAIAITVLGIIFIALAIVTAVVASSKEKPTSKTATTTSSQDVFPVSPPSDASSDSVSLSNYKLHVCNPTDADETETEFCIAADCFSGPHCACDVYFRDTESNAIKGLCDSCRVCDLNSDFAFDCSNLGSSVKECPTSSASDVEQEKSKDSISGTDFGQYSPPDSYTDRFCIPSTNSITELCYAGECTDDEKCRCDLYRREISTGNILGVCAACGVCADGSFSSDCVNVGLTATACSHDEDESLITNDPLVDYDDDGSLLANDQTIQETSSPQLTVSRGEPSESSSSSAASFLEDDYSCTDPSNGVEICYARSCSEPGCTCDAYFRDSTTKESVGSCTYCMICAQGAKNPVGLLCKVYEIDTAMSC